MEVCVGIDVGRYSRNDGIQRVAALDRVIDGFRAAGQAGIVGRYREYIARCLRPAFTAGGAVGLSVSALPVVPVIQSGGTSSSAYCHGIPGLSYSIQQSLARLYVQCQLV